MQRVNLAVILSISLMFSNALSAFALTRQELQNTSSQQVKVFQNEQIQQHESQQIEGNEDIEGNESTEARKESKERIAREEPAEEFPLIDAFLNTKMDYSQADEEEIYVLEFEKGKKDVVQLKEIKGRTLSFSLDLYNFSDNARSFVPRFGHVLGERTIEVQKINSGESGRRFGEFEDSFSTETVRETHPKKINNANITSELQEITIAPKSSSTLKITLNTADANNEFVEGFIYLDSKDNEQPDLSIPYFGYKGDWNAGKIIDDPMWMPSSLYKLTTILGKVPGHHDEDVFIELGKGDDDVINPLDIAFSNQNNAIGGKFPLNKIKEISLRLITLREARDLEVAVLDSNKKHLRTISTSHFYKKLIANRPLESSYQAKKIKNPSPLFKWDGKVYNSSTGGYQAVNDGQYYYRIRARINPDSEYQEIVIPVKIDNTRPTASALKVDTRGASFKIEDNHGIWFVGASIDNKPIELYKLSNNEYFLDKKHINKLTTSKLRIEAMDYAGNVMTPIVKELNKPLMKFSNLADIKSGKTDVLKGNIQDENVKTIEARSKDLLFDVEYDEKQFSINLKNRQEETKAIHIILKDELDNVLHSTQIEIAPQETSGAHSLNQRGPKIYTDLTDEKEEKFRKAFDTFMTNYVEPRYRDLEESSQKHPSGNKIYEYEIENISFDWRRNFENDEIDLSDYKLKLSSINTNKNGYEPLTTHILEAEEIEDLTFKLMEGTNIINAVVYKEENPEEILFSRGYHIQVDVEGPVISEDSLSIEYDENVDEDESDKGTIYTNSETLTINGKVKDEAEDWRMYVNGNNIDSNFQTGDYGNNEKEFSTTVNVKDGDKLTLEAIDKKGNKTIRRFDVVLDTTPPTISITPDDVVEYTDETIPDITFHDENPLREGDNFILVNGKLYTKNTQLKHYGQGKFFIYAFAVDKAGNTTQKTLEIKIEDEDRNFDQITLKKTVFEEEELKDPQNIVDMPNDFTAELVEPVDVSMEDTKVVLEITNPLGIRKRLEFSIKIAGFTPDITALELKQKHFLPRELQSEEALFDIPVGMSVMIEPVDASTVGEKMIQVTFFKNGKSLIKQYAIHILPELNARLKNKNFLKSELADINNVIEVDEGFHVVYVKHPDLNTLGEQEIVVLITDDYNHSLQMKFKIHVYEKEEHGYTPSPDYGSNEDISNHSSGSIPKVERITKNQKGECKRHKRDFVLGCGQF